MTAFYTLDENKLFLNILLQPKSSCDAIVGMHNNALKIKLTSPPLDNKANEHLIKFLAKEFKVAKKNITLLHGDTNKHKYICINSPQIIPDWMKTYGYIN